MKYVSFIEFKIRWRYRALVRRVSFSSGKVSRCAVIRDDHLRCYYLDNARCTAAWKYVRLAARTMNYARRVHLSFLSTFFPAAVAASVALTVAGMSTKKRSLTSLVLRRPIVGSSSIWTVIHKSQTCILVHADQRDNQNRHELRDSSASRRNNPKDIVNFNFVLILHYCDLRVSLYTFLLYYKLCDKQSL